MDQPESTEYPGASGFSQAEILRQLDPSVDAGMEPSPDQPSASPETGEIPPRVAIHTLPHLPERTSGGLSTLMDLHARKNPASEEADWEVRNLTTSDDSIRYTPMNTAAEAQFEDPGYLGTDRLNGCVATVAAYRDDQGLLKTWLGHYDAENVRETTDDGTLKLNDLLEHFAGEHPVKLVVAYPKDSSLPPADEQAGRTQEPPPGGIPMDQMIEEYKANLAPGSELLLIPYETSREAVRGHTLYVGQAASGRVEFGMDGHRVEVGEPERGNQSFMRAAREFAADKETELRREFQDSYDSEMLE